MSSLNKINVKIEIFFVVFFCIFFSSPSIPFCFFLCYEPDYSSLIYLLKKRPLIQNMMMACRKVQIYGSKVSFKGVVLNNQESLWSITYLPKLTHIHIKQLKQFSDLFLYKKYLFSLFFFIPYLQYFSPTCY